MAKRTSIIFMGTPDFAVPALQSLLDQPEKYDVKLVVTQPDRPAGRGQKLQAPPVKTLALKAGVPVIQPSSFKKDENVEEFYKTECDFLVVAAFGQILPTKTLQHPKIAPLNIHASLLPAYRGAAPIARAVMEGDELSGVTIQWMIEALDQGDILLQAPCPLTDEDTSASLHDKLKEIGAKALIQCLELFAQDKVVRRSQDARVGTYAAKLSKAESALTFDQSAFYVHRAIMGMNPWPVAHCQVLGKVMKIYRSRILARPAQAEPGTVLDTSDGEIVVACSDACVGLLEVQMENRNRLSSSEFLKGHPLPNGLILGTSKVL